MGLTGRAEVPGAQGPRVQDRAPEMVRRERSERSANDVGVVLRAGWARLVPEPPCPQAHTNGLLIWLLATASRRVARLLVLCAITARGLLEARISWAPEVALVRFSKLPCQDAKGSE